MLAAFSVPVVATSVHLIGEAHEQLSGVLKWLAYAVLAAAFFWSLALVLTLFTFASKERRSVPYTMPHFYANRLRYLAILDEPGEDPESAESVEHAKAKQGVRDALHSWIQAVDDIDGWNRERGKTISRSVRWLVGALWLLFTGFALISAPAVIRELGTLFGP